MVKKFIVGPLQVNSYIVSDQDKRAVIIDPGEEGERLAAYLEEEELELQAIFVTHGHFDHIAAVDFLAARKKVPVYTHREEGRLMEDPALNLSEYFRFPAVQARADHFVQHGDRIRISEELDFQIIEVPGHSPISPCFYSDRLKCLFSGDTLFKQSVGRTDLYRGNSDDLLIHIRERLLALPEDTIVYPGHGLKTTIGKEKQENPYLQQDFYSSW